MQYKTVKLLMQYKTTVLELLGVFFPCEAAVNVSAPSHFEIHPLTFEPVKLWALFQLKESQ